MSLHPGGPRKVDDKYVLDNEAVKHTMAGAMEDAMIDVYSKVKGESLSTAGEEDRRLLFVAIARGILKYLEDNEDKLLASVKVSHDTGPIITHTVSDLDLNIKMDK